MDASVAFGAQGNQVLLGIVAGMATKFLVVDLKVGHFAARLTSPAVSTEHLVAEILVLLGVEAQARTFW